MVELEQITNKINKYELKLKELKKKRKEICSHKRIDRDCYIEDEFVYEKKYIYTYECLDCGKYAQDESPNYKL